MRLILLALAVFSLTPREFVAVKTYEEDQRLEPLRIEKKYKFTEYRYEPEFLFGDEKAYLYCNLVNATGHRVGNVISWYRNKTLLKNSKHHSIRPNNTLEIHKPKRTDAGVYVARHKVIERSAPLEYDCNVRFFAKPLVLDFPKSVTLHEGDTLDLICEVKGYPAAKVTWFKDGRRLYPKNATISETHFSPWDGVDDARLVITKLAHKEAGVFKCVAYSDFFKYSHSKHLVVRITDKMAALYPLLGILGGVIILSLIIVTHEANAKKRIKKEEAILYRQSFVNITEHVSG